MALSSGVEARLERLDQFGIAAQVLYPNLLGLFPYAFMSLGIEEATRCVQVFNDFQVEWCSADPKRLIPLAFLPFWDVDAAVAELRRCSQLGYHGFNWGHGFEKITPAGLRHSVQRPPRVTGWHSLYRHIETELIGRALEAEQERQLAWRAAEGHDRIVERAPDMISRREPPTAG